MYKQGKYIQKLISNVLSWLYQPFENIVQEETFRYALTGGANTVLDIFLYFITYNFVLQKQIVYIYKVAISPHIAAFLIVFPITFTTGFILAKYITFTSSHFRGRKQLIRYGITVIGAIVINYVLLKLFVDAFGIYPTLSKVIITVIVVIYSYLMQKYFSFKTGEIKKIFKMR